MAASFGTRQKTIYSARLRALYIFLIIAAIALAILGQWQLLKQHLIAGGILYACAMVAFILATRPNPTQDLAVSPKSKQKISAPPILLLTSFMISFVICDMVHSQISFPHSALIIPLGWVLSILLFTVGILRGCGWRFPAGSKLVQSVKANRLEIGLVALVMLLALGMRTIYLTTLPYAFANDEGVVAVQAERIQDGEFSSIFATGPSDIPALTYVPTLFSIDLFGDNVAADRIVSVLEGLLTVLFVYLAAKEAFGKRVAFIATVVMAFLPVHVHFSRTGFNTILFSFFPPLVIWLVLRAIRTGRVSSFLLAGFATAGTFFTHMGAWISIGFAVGILGYFCVFRRGYLRQFWSHLLVFLGTFGITVAPQAAFFIKHPEFFGARLNMVGVVQTSWLTDQMAATGISPFAILAGQFLKSALAFVSGSTPSGFYNTPYPYFVPVLAVLLMLGMGVVIFRLRKPASLFLFAWFWSVIIFGGMLTTDAPASHRLIAAYPAAAILVGVGLSETLDALRHFMLIPRRLGIILTAVVLLGTSAAGSKFYLVDYRANNWYGDHSNEVEFESITLMQQLGNKYRLVLLGPPEVSVNFPSYQFLLSDFQKRDIPYGSLFSAVNDPGSTLFVAIPSRASELDAIQQEWPGGTRVDLLRRWASNEALFSAYIYPSAPVTLYIPHAHPVPPSSSPLVLPSWAGWVELVLAAIFLDLVLLPWLWRRFVKKQRSSLRAPWVWIVWLGKKIYQLVQD